MPGIVANVLDNGNTVYGANTRDVNIDPNKGTVAGQLHSILSSGSPYIEQAKAGALDTGNARGLINSNMTAGAGEAAAIGAALPIAQQDASMRNQVNEFNAGATNTSNLATAGAANQTGLQEQAGKIQSGLSAQAAGQQSKLQAEAGTIQSGLSAQAGGIQSGLSAQQSAQKQQEAAHQATLDITMQQLKGQQAVNLANIEAQYKGLMQTSASATSTFTAYSRAVADILNDPNTSAEQKTAAIDAQNSMLSSSLSVISAINDPANPNRASLQNLVTFSAPAPATTPEVPAPTVTPASEFGG